MLFRSRKGSIIYFEELGGSSGVLALNSETHADLISDLMAIKGTRGVSVIDQTVYEWLKKNRPKSSDSASNLNLPGGLPPLRVLHRQVADASRAVQDDPALRDIPQQPAVSTPITHQAPVVKTPDATVAPVPPAKVPNLGQPKPAPAAK